MPNPVVHFEIVGNDAKKLQDFYAGAFDWKIDANNPMNYGLIKAGTGGIAGGIGPAQQGGPRATFYVEVPDLQATLSKIESTGGKTVMPPMELPDMVTIAMFTDPEGNLVGLVKSGSM